MHSSTIKPPVGYNILFPSPCCCKFVLFLNTYDVSCITRLLDCYYDVTMQSINKLCIHFAGNTSFLYYSYIPTWYWFLPNLGLEYLYRKIIHRLLDNIQSLLHYNMIYVKKKSDYFRYIWKISENVAFPKSFLQYNVWKSL